MAITVQPDPCEDAISRQAAIEEMHNIVKQTKEGFWEPAYIPCVDVFTALKQLPPAHPAIIHCRDCKHYYFADNRISQEQRYICDLDGDRWQPDDFCSYAERREE